VTAVRQRLCRASPDLVGPTPGGPEEGATGVPARENRGENSFKRGGGALESLLSLAGECSQQMLASEHLRQNGAAE